jgi:hypothetical protein
MLTKDVLLIKVFCVITFIAWLIFSVLNLQNNNYEFSASGAESGFRINKRSGEVEYCDVGMMSNLKDRSIVLCIPEKKHDKKTYLSPSTSKNINYEELAKEYGGRIVFGGKDKVVEHKIPPASK